jgi:hypothetical protein
LSEFLVILQVMPSVFVGLSVRALVVYWVGPATAPVSLAAQPAATVHKKDHASPSERRQPIKCYMIYALSQRAAALGDRADAASSARVISPQANVHRDVGSHETIACAIRSAMATLATCTERDNGL